MIASPSDLTEERQAATEAITYPSDHPLVGELEEQMTPLLCYYTGEEIGRDELGEFKLAAFQL
ncbi:MAG: hypothetical protein WCJ09_13000 [Planctomycetota bacterium]